MAKATKYSKAELAKHLKSDEKLLMLNRKLTRSLRLFLCHSSADTASVKELYNRLLATDMNIDPWLDEEKLIPGQDWSQEITKAVRLSDVVIVCLSSQSIHEAGHAQKEIKYALDIADEQPEGTIFLIPLRLEECEVPDRLRRWQWVNYFDRNGHARLMSALRIRANTLGIDVKLDISAVEKRNSNYHISILFWSADPTDASRLRLGEEMREIQGKLQMAKWRERFELNVRTSVRIEDASQSLLDTQPNIVHFSGHGAVDGALYFEDKHGKIQPVHPKALSSLFEQFSNQINCIILSACYSEIQANAIAEHINYVIGISQVLSDQAAIAFAVGFYQALGAGRNIEEAYKLGCVQIMLQNAPEHLIPILIRKMQT